MPASRAQRATTAARRTKAIGMRLAGAEFETIATKLGYASRGAACQDVTRAMEANIVEQHASAELLRHVELLRLDVVQNAVWPAAVTGNCRAVETVLKVIDRRCRLLGLDPPVRAELVTIDAVDAQIAALEAELGLQPGERPSVA